MTGVITLETFRDGEEGRLTRLNRAEFSIGQQFRACFEQVQRELVTRRTHLISGAIETALA